MSVNLSDKHHPGVWLRKLKIYFQFINSVSCTEKKINYGAGIAKNARIPHISRDKRF